MNYNQYDVEDFVADESFQAYATRSSKKDFLFWEGYKKDNPAQKEIIDGAEHVIRIIGRTKPEISEDDYQLEWIRFNQMLWEVEARSGYSQTSRSRSSFFFKWAAIFLLLAGVSYIYFTDNRMAQRKYEVRYVTKYNPSGQKSTIYLDDGSTIVLNADSRLVYPEVFPSNARSIYLEGEAFFDVSNDGRFFEVITGDLKTIVSGTSFNISHYDDENETTIALASGTVIVVDSNSNQSIVLHPGEKANFKGNGPPTVEIFNPEIELSWKNGEIVFLNADFNEVKKRLERWYGVTIETRSKKGTFKNNEHTTAPDSYSGTGTLKDHTEPRDWKVKGRFKNESLRKVLETLSYTQGFDYTLDGKKVVLYF